MKRKNKTRAVYAPLDFAVKMAADAPCKTDDLDTLIRTFDEIEAKAKDVPEKQVLSHIPFTLYTCADWLKYKQAYRITQALADDLFGMDDLDFPMDALHLPFPTVFLDFSGITYHPGSDCGGKTLIGVFVTLDEVPYQSMTLSLCSIVLLWKPCPLERLKDTDFPYAYGGISFDYDPDHMELTLGETIESLTEQIPEGRKVMRDAMLFLAYLSSEKPDITEGTSGQTTGKRPSPSPAKPAYRSVRKWDVGVRYMREKQKAAGQGEMDRETESDGAEPMSVNRNSRRPHIRKAHWHTYRVGPGRKEKKVLWLAPITVGVKEETPVVVRSSTGERMRGENNV